MERLVFWFRMLRAVPEGHGTNGQPHGHLEERGYGPSTRFVARTGVGFVDLTYFLVSKEDCRGIKVSAIISFHIARVSAT